MDNRLILNMETFLAQGDLAQASRALLSLHGEWESLDQDTQDSIKRLEGIYLSLVHLQMRGSDKANG